MSSQIGGVTLAPPPDPKTRLRRLPPTLCTRNHIPATSCSKTPRGLLAPLGVPGLFVQVKWVHRAVGGDSGEVIGPFMHVGTYPTRHLAHICYFSDLDKKTRRVGTSPTSLHRYRGRTLS